MSDPFSQYEMISIYLEPLYDQYTKKYDNYITLSGMPTGALQPLVKQIRPARLSDFQQSASYGDCVYILCKNAYKQEYMRAQDLPKVYGFLTANGYQIQNDISKLTFMSNIDTAARPTTNTTGGRRRFVCMFSATP